VKWLGLVANLDPFVACSPSQIVQTTMKHAMPVVAQPLVTLSFTVARRQHQEVCRPTCLHSIAAGRDKLLNCVPSLLGSVMGPRHQGLCKQLNCHSTATVIESRKRRRSGNSGSGARRSAIAVFIWI
jgi:hypothetical protein